MMATRSFFPLLLLTYLLALLPLALAQASTAAPTAAGSTTSPASASAPVTAASSPTTGPGTNLPPNITTGEPGILTGPPDVRLHVPTLSVGRIELDVDNLSADLNLNAQVANLVTINAGVAISVQKVNITISDVDASLELNVRLGHLVDIVNRVFQSLDLNPLLITALNNVTSIVDQVVGEVDGLLGSVTQGGSTVSFVVDNLGNIVQQVAGAAGAAPVSELVGNYLQNMTATGVEKTLTGGLVQKQFSYSPLGALVDIVFNAAGQVVQATVEGAGKGSASTSAAPSTSTAAATKR